LLARESEERFRELKCKIFFKSECIFITEWSSLRVVVLYWANMKNLKMLITKEFSVMSIGLKLSDKGVELGF
jgi:hypothetical protein